MAHNHRKWDDTLKFICMAYNTMIHEGTGFSTFYLTFGRDANLPSLLATTLNLKSPELVRLWKKRHEKYIRRARERIEKSKEKYKRVQDAKIVILEKNFEIGDLVLLENNKTGKLLPDWKGPATIIGIETNNNHVVLINNERQRIHENKLKLYYS
ncbi:uncharacterized protein LOC117181215 [Belonocnema kinseyi]|uniref:uncharacterized protein LOC117181215 n=1 Tax=Belonocnema kinseyi TaxID=2817044 RepID=UPI00143CFB3A|nr:uncharacterized protein LOC117181215 [Belonocnema kinseyi]